MNNEVRNYRDELFCLLHGAKEFDNEKIWAGRLAVETGGQINDSRIVRFFIDSQKGEKFTARIRVEFFAAGVTNQPDFSDSDIDAHVWMDIDDLGFIDEKGVYQAPLPRYEKMKLMKDPEGHKVRRNGSVLFVSKEFDITKTGVFNFTVSFSADTFPCDSPDKKWVAINDIAHNRDGAIVVSPKLLKDCPSISEICLRKFRAQEKDGKFTSGRISCLIDDLAAIPTDIVYLLPFFQPGYYDSATGADVRKGTLGSIYAVKDFFKVAQEIVTPIEETDIAALVRDGRITQKDIDDCIAGHARNRFPNPESLLTTPKHELISVIGGDALTQIIGRAELRMLTQKAHSLGKRVIFDLVVMQTSRDSDLIREHLDWYSLDENGHPKKNSIAWLDYSDVALFDLAFNKPLQNYLGGVAPYWIETCGFDGVRIDASQTVDRPFLKQVKNRINAADPDAFVVGETLCPLDQAVDVPADMIYTLLVDHHVHTTNAGTFINIFEEIHRTYSPGTVGMAYFENHDSVRATLEWHRMFNDQMNADPTLAHYWSAQAGAVLNSQQLDSTWDLAYFPSLLKNIMCSLINCTAGTQEAVLFAYAIELGTDWGEEARTDFENENILYPDNRSKPPHSYLHDGYMRLAEIKAQYPVFHRGRVFYMRNSGPPNDPNDKLLVYGKYDADTTLVVAANLDFANAHQGRYKLDFIDIDTDAVYAMKVLFNTFALFKSPQRFPTPQEMHGSILKDNGLPLLISPLCATVIEISKKID